MPLKKIRPIPRKRKPVDQAVKAMRRAFSIAEAKKDKLMSARVSKLYHDHMFARIMAVIEKAKSKNSWEFMDGCFYQAVEVYAVASIAYERHNSPIMEDALFDSLAKFLNKNFNKIPENCVDEYNLRKEWFKAGTGSGFRLHGDRDLDKYNNRLLELLTQETADERKATRVRPRLLRKAAKRGSPKDKGKLRRPV